MRLLTVVKIQRKADEIELTFLHLNKHHQKIFAFQKRRFGGVHKQRGLTFGLF